MLFLLLSLSSCIINNYWFWWWQSYHEHPWVLVGQFLIKVWGIIFFHLQLFLVALNNKSYVGQWSVKLSLIAMVDLMVCARALNSNYAQIRSRWQIILFHIPPYCFIFFLLMVVLSSKWLQSDKKIKTLTDTAELIEDAVSATFIVSSKISHIYWQH